MKQEIELGDKVRCIHTGFEGTAVCESKFINGCTQWLVLPRPPKSSKSMKEMIMPEEVSIDSQSLEVISKGKKLIEEKETGGPMRKGIRIKGF